MLRPSILLIETDTDTRVMYSEYLRAHGMSVITAVGSGDALRKAATVDVIVTGIRLAGTFDGVELVRRIRTARRTARASIIVLTACAFEPDRQRALAAGCDRFLPKPCLPEQLEAEIRELHAAKHSPRASAAARARSPRRRRAGAS